MEHGPAGRPFYLQPPWNVLFELHKLQRIRPWEVNLAYLLASFLEQMNRLGETDFRASGLALDSSATIYLMKSSLLLKLEEAPPAPPKLTEEPLPPPLLYPLRHELTSTTIQSLLEALEEALRGERLFPLKSVVESVLPPPPDILPPVDLYLVEIEERMKGLYELLLRLVERGELILFSKVTAGLERLEAIKTFIILLFLAQRGQVSLWQEDELGEIYVTLPGGSAVAGGEATAD